MPDDVSRSDSPKDATNAPEYLLALAAGGDAAALQELVVRHLPALRTYVRLHADPGLRLRESQSDLVQSACCDVLQDLASFTWRGEGQFRRWLFEKTMSKIIERRRYHMAERRNPARLEARSGDELCASSWTASQLAIRAEDLSMLEECFDELAAEHRQVIVLAKVLGLEHAAIAAELGRSEGATRMLLHRAMTRLATLMRRRERG